MTTDNLIVTEEKAREFRNQKRKEDPNNKFIPILEKIETEKELEGIRILIKDNKQEGIYQLSNHLLNTKIIITFKDTDEVFIYNKQEGIYENLGEKILSSQIQSILRNLNNTHIVNETLAHIKRRTYENREKIQEPKDKICLIGGVLDLNSMQVEPYSSNLFFFGKIPVVYLRNATCPKIMKFISEIVKDDSINVIQELFGYCLYKSYPIHKAFMLVGTGANGKSTLINLLRMFLGQRNVASLQLQSLENNRFSLSSLFGKLANMFADLPSKALQQTSFFKMLTGEDLIPAEKKFKDKFFFINYAKQIFSCNQIPKTPDDTDAFFRRWIILMFPNQFIGNKVDKKLLERLTTPEEMSGLLNWAIEGLKRLLEQGDFSNAKSINEVRDEYVRKSDSVASFVIDHILISFDDFVAKKQLYTHYTDYCRNNNYPMVPENMFHKELQRQVRVEDYRPNLDTNGNKQRVQCWKGINYNG